MLLKPFLLSGSSRNRAHSSDVGRGLRLWCAQHLSLPRLPVGYPLAAALSLGHAPSGESRGVRQTGRESVSVFIGVTWSKLFGVENTLTRQHLSKLSQLIIWVYLTLSSSFPTACLCLLSLTGRRGSPQRKGRCRKWWGNQSGDGQGPRWGAMWVCICVFDGRLPGLTCAL